MALKFEKSSIIIELVYKIEYGKNINIFHSYFVQNNKTKCKMIVNNKLSELTDKYQVFKENMNLLKVKLLILKNTKINFSHMFYQCKFLTKFNIISQEENKLDEEYKSLNRQYENLDKDILDDSNNQLNMTFKNAYTNDINTLFTQATNIYYKNNILYENNDKEKMNSIINLSHDFLSVLYSTIKSQNNNNNSIEYNSFNENLFFFNSLKNKRLNINRSLDYILATNLSYMFYGYSSLLSITGLSKIKTDKVINFSHMFEYCSLLKEICDITKWETKNVDNLSRIFSCCSSIVSLLDISNWNTYNVTEMNGIFFNCSSLLSLPNISKWNIDKVIDIKYIFYKCLSLLLLPDISKWDTRNIIYMNAIFSDCLKL